MSNSNYDTLRHELDTKMLRASNLASEPEQKSFVNQTFKSIYEAYQSKRISQADYVKLINRLAAYKGGSFNDYLDILVGAAQMGMLDIALAGNVQAFSPEAARQRRGLVTRMTGLEHVEPEGGEDDRE